MSLLPLLPNCLQDVWWVWKQLPFLLSSNPPTQTLLRPQEAKHRSTNFFPKWRRQPFFCRDLRSANPWWLWWLFPNGWAKSTFWVLAISKQWHGQTKIQIWCLLLGIGDGYIRWTNCSEHVKSVCWSMWRTMHWGSLSKMWHLGRLRPHLNVTIMIFTPEQFWNLTLVCEMFFSSSTWEWRFFVCAKRGDGQTKQRYGRNENQTCCHRRRGDAIVHS